MKVGNNQRQEKGTSQVGDNRGAQRSQHCQAQTTEEDQGQKSKDHERVKSSGKGKELGEV